MPDSKSAADLIAETFPIVERSGALIYQLMPKIAQEVGAVPKGQKSFKGWPFRGIDDVWNRYGPVLWKYGVTVGSEVSEREVHHIPNPKKQGETNIYATLRLRLRFIAPDGSSVAGQAYGGAIDYDHRAVAQAHSDAAKKIYFDVFTPPVDKRFVDDPDARIPKPQVSKQPFVELASADLEEMSLEDLRKYAQKAIDSGASEAHKKMVSKIGQAKAKEEGE